MSIPRGRSLHTPLFVDREDAGRRLASQLPSEAGAPPLVLGIPRGGVLVAAAVATYLHAPLDVLVARKVGAPWDPELAIGAVTAAGDRILNEPLIRSLRLSQDAMEAAFQREQAVALAREEILREGLLPPAIAGRTILLVDDGLATGATMLAALRTLRAQGAGRVVAAAPVGSPEACTAARAKADELVCLAEPAAFQAVGYFYQDFEPVSDAHVLQVLHRHRQQRSTGD